MASDSYLLVTADIGSDLDIGYRQLLPDCAAVVATDSATVTYRIPQAPCVEVRGPFREAGKYADEYLVALGSLRR